MSKFKQREMPWHEIIECDYCMDLIVNQDREIQILKQRIETLELELQDASFRDWADSYDNWYSSQINYDLVQEYERGH